MNTNRIIIQTLILYCIFLSNSCTKEKITKRDYPRVATGQVTNINTDGATFNGTFLQAGNSEIIDHGFVFSTRLLPNIRSDEKVSLGLSEGRDSFTATATAGMAAGEIYYVSAYAQNKDNIFYAEPVSFVSKGSAAPEILEVIPNEGLPYDTIIIKGKNFGSSTSNNTVVFNYRTMSIISISNVELVVRAPLSYGAEFANISVTVAGQTAQKVNGFRYLKPEITGFSPTQGAVGDTITITGKHFHHFLEIKFNQTYARHIQHDQTSARVIVPHAFGSEQAVISLTIDGFTSIAEQMFTYVVKD